MAKWKDPESFIRQQASMGRAWEMEKKDKAFEKKGIEVEHDKGEPTCWECKYQNKCQKFREMRTGGMNKVVSYGGNLKNEFICDRYEPLKKKSNRMSDKDIKKLMKGFRK